MTSPQQTYETSTETTDERLKVAARCRECGGIYSAWLFADDTVQPIGRKDGCRCGASAFEAISK
ncbi:hypothetical protein Halxa_3923 [Halopiger xanaduensis SH-6]|uniref:Uncharacterized protein n=1 Tax=Halopiger xanaduensis (strain DSM 18323 / JCM 14033 / SH-6) TaxID=797210 RepID=F8D396_HALXS|nr:hypothetical protein Halxa_3923 [Halopiger xanaduensis SH-6]